MLLIKRFLKHIENLSDLKLWLIFFVITLSIILMVQLVVLPYILPFWHAGDGLLAAGGDWVAFHKAAVEMAEDIKVEGWSAWELRPKGWMPAGVAGAIYALSWPKPWTLAPLNAVVHAFTALMVIKLLFFISENRRASLIAALPFVFFPSAMLWYTQIHRDGYNILGMLLFLYGIFYIFKKDLNISKWSITEGYGFLAAFSGIILLWLSRPHTLVMFQYVGLLLLLIIIVYLMVLFIKSIISWKRILVKVVTIALVMGMTSIFYSLDGDSKYERELTLADENMMNDNVLFMQEADDYLWASRTQVALPDKQVAQQTRLERLTEEYHWERTPWLPQRIDNQFYSLAILRSVSYPISYGDTASGIDTDVSFHSAVDFIYYLPRALQISFLAPFPGEWFAEGTREATTFFRRVSAFEMSFIYLMLIPVVYGLWIWRKKIEIYLTLLFCTLMMLPIVYSIPNVGTIYRYRYGYLMLIVCLGVVALYIFIEKFRHRKRVEDEG